MTTARLFSVLVLAFGLPLGAAANDSAAVLEAGGLRLVRDVPVEILSEELLISPDLISVDYVFRAADDRGLSTIVAFPLPEYDLSWLGPEVLNGTGDSVESRSAFRVWVDGEEVTPNLEIKALRNGIDVTQFLADFGVPVGSLDYQTTMDSLQAMPQEAKDWFAAADIVRWNEGFDPEPRWTVRATYFWTQNFPPGRDVHVRHTYTPIAGGFIVTDSVSPGFDPDDYCMTDAERAGLRNRLAASPHGAVLARQVRYVLTTGANWSGPIAQFRLLVDKGNAEDMVSLCFDGMTRTGPTRFESTVRDFVPERELDLLFIEALR